MKHYYNEIEPYAVQWLKNLIAAGHLPAGDVDDRSVTEVHPNDLTGYTQCHFFAGIGGWALAARLAGWPDDRELWTGSCPCQPFSQIGLGRGVDDERHLWPALLELVRQRRPRVVAGEQVASAAGRAWFEGVRADLEALGYAAWGADLCAASVGAPHVRQRIFWLGHADDTRLEGHGGDGDTRRRPAPARSVSAPDGPVPWDTFVPITDLDGVTRRSEPGARPLVARLPTHMGRLRAYGNAIVPQVAAEVLGSYLDIFPTAL